MYLLFLTLFIFHRLERLTESHFEKVKEFMKCIKVLYASTLCVSSDKSPTCSQIIPILTKLEAHYSTSDDDNVFVAAIKEKVWGDLEKRYQVFAADIYVHKERRQTTPFSLLVKMSCQRCTCVCRPHQPSLRGFSPVLGML